ncbi:MAG: c-type cytochrome [Thiobacillus sp.]|nr:c-type cytochrome [Thiobacillus sp.]MDO9385321.1 c-type cytochrome [Thiobacillus sp.]
MSLIKFSCITSLLFVTAFAAAAPNRNTDKPAPPAPQALHEKLTQISQDPAMLSAAIQRGQKDASVCRHCHGAGGNSVLPEVPNLASQNAAYLLEQMNKFVQGQRKSSAFMEGMIKALTPDERIAIALFLSQQPLAHKPATAHSAAGKRLYDKLCISCHGATGTGTHLIPRLAGQQEVYLEGSLKRYRSGNGERIDPRMAAYTRNLKDADIRSLAAYLTALQP